MKLIYPIALMILAQIISFFQLQGQMKWEFAKHNPLVMMFLGLPIALIFIYTTRLFNEHFLINWPGRLIGQGVGIVVFSAMSWIVFREPITLKVFVCILLALSIVLIQIFWK